MNWHKIKKTQCVIFTSLLSKKQRAKIKPSLVQQSEVLTVTNILRYIKQKLSIYKKKYICRMKITHDLRTSQSVYTFKTKDTLMKKKQHVR